jgi:hypothetical protein
MVSREIAQNNDWAVLRFVAASSLKTIQLGLSLATMLSENQLRTVLTGMARLAFPDHAPAQLKRLDALADPARLRGLFSPEVLRYIQPFAGDCIDAMDNPQFVQQMLDIGNRAGFIFCGSLGAAVTGLRLAVSRPDGRLAEAPGLGRLMSFVFSRNHMELRRRMGISFDY